MTEIIPCIDRVPTYGQKTQYVKTLPSLPALSNSLTSIIQQKAGSILYYARAMDYTILRALSDIYITQAKPTENTKK